ncbi:YceI-like domain-containing protein [Catalinimonas alkaloidigena]|uniref:YceI-like domain-containing protein n=1 Tax=Catalinimonas alkaloidigena TaxID=1075417 RepID=A0A1G9J9W2_9BACT|nr:YceI family protein [Catalinimonas alkaloidigena]SDL33924.1 YceI-like domain-containing protein [Catalinimonas alkaloidigena]
MHTFLSFLLLFSLVVTPPQEGLWLSQSGEISFFSSAPLEDIEAVNKSARSALNFETGEVAVKLRIRGFDFPNNLMEEHFNENYLESAKYPEATFAGKLQETIDPAQPGTYPVSARGTLTIHGVAQNRTLTGHLTITPRQITLETDFEVVLVDHKIERPSLMLMKIAEKVDVKARFTYQPSGNAQ